MQQKQWNVKKGGDGRGSEESTPNISSLHY